MKTATQGCRQGANLSATIPLCSAAPLRSLPWKIRAMEDLTFRKVTLDESADITATGRRPNHTLSNTAWRKQSTTPSSN
jgi:hypothetical protein